MTISKLRVKYQKQSCKLILKIPHQDNTKILHYIQNDYDEIEMTTLSRRNIKHKRRWQQLKINNMQNKMTVMRCRNDHRDAKYKQKQRRAPKDSKIIKAKQLHNRLTITEKLQTTTKRHNIDSITHWGNVTDTKSSQYKYYA